MVELFDCVVGLCEFVLVWVFWWVCLGLFFGWFGLDLICVCWLFAFVTDFVCYWIVCFVVYFNCGCCLI